MPYVISQGIATPANVTTGGTIQATDVSTLYSALGTFNVPFNLSAFRGAANSGNVASDAAVTLTIGGTASNDFSCTASTTQAIMFLTTFSWSTSGATLAPSLQFRFNAAVVAPASTLVTAATGSGMLYVVIGPHDATVLRPVMGWIVDGTQLLNVFGNVNLPNSSVTSLGVTFANATAGTLTLAHTRVWVEG